MTPRSHPRKVLWPEVPQDELPGELMDAVGGKQPSTSPPGVAGAVTAAGPRRGVLQATKGQTPGQHDGHGGQMERHVQRERDRNVAAAGAAGLATAKHGVDAGAGQAGAQGSVSTGHPGREPPSWETPVWNPGAAFHSHPSRLSTYCHRPQQRACRRQQEAPETVTSTSDQHQQRLITSREKSSS